MPSSFASGNGQIQKQIIPIGLLINPIAGMGGRVGLKGTDGDEILQTALSRGAIPIANDRARDTLHALLENAPPRIQWYVGPGLMGEQLCKELNLSHVVVLPDETSVSNAADSQKPDNRFGLVGGTSDVDTIAIATRMLEKDIRLLMFFGGDGTAANIAMAIDRKIPAFGAPTGVKMFSAVFALTPRIASQLLLRFLAGEAQLEERDVLDIDESAYRRGELLVSLKGVLNVPVIPDLVQSSKEVSSANNDETSNKQGVANTLVEEWDSTALYLLGPGSTVETLAQTLNLNKTLLGVDVVKGDRVLASDATETQILHQIHQHKGPIILIVSPIGRQGFVLGRGNQQLSPNVLQHISKENLKVIATRTKMKEITTLHIDTGSLSMDAKFQGYTRVIIDYREERIFTLK